jgi:hypothetical protein
MARARGGWNRVRMTTSWGEMEADRAFTRAARARRRTALIARFRHRARACTCLAVSDAAASRGRGTAVAAGHDVREIPLAAISATVEPNRARQFDCGFRPAPHTRARWRRIWLAEQRGTVLPPISVVRIGEGYAIRDGHHRVSVAKARGAVTITARVVAA